MSDDIGHDLGYPERNQPPPYEGDFGSPGEMGVGIQTVLELILHELVAPTVRPKSQITLTVLAGGVASDIFATHVRYYIDKVVILQAPAVPFDIKAGSANILSGFGITAVGVFDCSVIVDAGADIQAISQGAAIYAAKTNILLVGWIIN